MPTTADSLTPIITLSSSLTEWSRFTCGHVETNVGTRTQTLSLQQKPLASTGPARHPPSECYTLTNCRNEPTKAAGPDLSAWQIPSKLSGFLQGRYTHHILNPPCKSVQRKQENLIWSAGEVPVEGAKCKPRIHTLHDETHDYRCTTNV